MDLSNIVLDSVGGQFVVAREAERLFIVHVASQKVTSLDISADSAIINPSGCLIGLRFANKLQIFNLKDMAKPVREASGIDGFRFWRWTDESTILFVRHNKVYRWDVNSNEKAEAKMDLEHATDSKALVTDCGVSSHGVWWYVQCSNQLSLYNSELNRSQPTVIASAACFANRNVKGRQRTLFSFIYARQSDQRRLCRFS